MEFPAPVLKGVAAHRSGSSPGHIMSAARALKELTWPCCRPCLLWVGGLRRALTGDTITWSESLRRRCDARL
eukprot:10582914-Alexandrium_andersonii.AAC.1